MAAVTEKIRALEIPNVYCNRATASFELAVFLRISFAILIAPTQITFTCSKSTIETLEKCEICS